MIRSLRACFAIWALAATAAACQSAPRTTAQASGPSLAVLLVVDQLTPELLERYGHLFTGGLRRLLGEGFRFENATHDHANTLTAVGHVTLSTGVHPTRHGIVANTWSERDGDRWRSVYAVEDPSVDILGHLELEGMSPANIDRPGLADWIVASDERARVVSLSAKDRSAIGLASQAMGDVYWIPDEDDEFVTSDHYVSSYPDWIVRFNESRMPELFADTVWTSTVPRSAESLTRPDSSQYEVDGDDSTFPHRASELAASPDPADMNLWRNEFTPFPDRAVVALTIEALRTRELGQREAVDFLGVSLSQTDLVGHSFGPGSREQLDNLLRLDAELGRLLTALDEEVGRGRWVLALSADHGVLEIPEHLAEGGANAGRLTRQHRADLLERIDAGSEGGPWAIRELVATLPFVAGAYTFEELEGGQPADSFAVLYSNSHSRIRLSSLAARSGVYARFQPSWLQWDAGIATHGSPYSYDRHVPLIFLGPGIPAGVSSERVATVDVAPTLAELAGIAAPDDLDGRSLGPMLRR